MISRDPSPFAPIPGTVPAPRGLFVDRWGTLLQTPEAGFARSADDVEFSSGAVDALFRASQAGWCIYLLGNEDAVARGQVSDAAWQEIDARVLEGLGAGGVRIARDYTCLDHPTEGVPGHQKDSVYLLPNTGAFYHAAHEDGIELRKSWVVGDSSLELVAGWRAGLRQAGVRTGLAVGDGTFKVTPDVLGSDLSDVVLGLLELEGALHP
ncbi:MAG: HAD hydrolase-like protein [Planctomycetota bacterium]